MTIKFKVNVVKVCTDIVSFYDKDDKSKKVSRDSWCLVGMTDDGDIVQVKYYEKPPFWDSLKKGSPFEVSVSQFDGGRTNNHIAECVGAF